MNFAEFKPLCKHSRLKQYHPTFHYDPNINKEGKFTFSKKAIELEEYKRNHYFYSCCDCNKTFAYDKKYDQYHHNIVRSTEESFL